MEGEGDGVGGVYRGEVVLRGIVYEENGWCSGSCRG